jgi:hypothetical protein
VSLKIGSISYSVEDQASRSDERYLSLDEEGKEKAITKGWCLKNAYEASQAIRKQIETSKKSKNTE